LDIRDLFSILCIYIYKLKQKTMAYFNHAFNKLFLGTGVTQTDGMGPENSIPSVIPGVVTEGGFVTTSGVFTYQLNELSKGVKTTYQNFLPTGAPYNVTNYTQGYFGIFDPKTNQTITPENCCNIYFAGSSIYPNDKIGPYHGGYEETNKSKMVNPRYVQKFYRVDSCLPKNEIVHIGSTAFTAGGAITEYDVNQPDPLVLAPNLTNVLINLEGGTGTGAQVIVSTDALGEVTSYQVVDNINFLTNTYLFGKGYTEGDVLTIPGVLGGTFELTVDAVTEAGGDASCCKEFLCGETYYLRLDIKGSPALRFLNHNAYYNAEAYTGCCPADSITPTPVDSTEVMIKWANAFLNYELISPFMQIIIQDETGVLWYEPGTAAADLPLGANTWNNYVSPGHTEDACAGLIINGAYVDTKFGDCSFQISDFYEKEPVRIFASEVDLSGDPCTFDGICVVKECEARQANGLGETVLRDLILSEQYRQNFFSTDIRIREITQGNQMLNVINRNALYTKYYLLHNVPRFNNPTGVFDNDRYLLEFVTNTALPTFEETVNEWLSKCGTECAFEEVTCIDECTSVVTFPPFPLKGGRFAGGNAAGNAVPGVDQLR
jgi:hypothetical protein